VEHLADTRGCVVHISDVAGVIPFKRYKAYSRTKSALLDLAQRQALELCVRGVRVNVVCPGSVLFPERYTEALRRSIIAEIPLGRAGRAEDVAEAVAFLARATFVTGQCLAVDGGRLLTGLAGLAVPGGARSLH